MSDQTAGQAAPQAAQSTDALGAVNEDRVVEIVNRAISARNKGFEKQIGEKLDSNLKEIRDSLSKIGEAREKPAKEGKKGKDDEDADPAVKSMQRELADLKGEVTRAKQIASDERAKNRNATLRSKVTDELAKHDIKDPTRVKHALALLVDSEKRISFADDEGDSIVFRDSNDDSLDLPTGLKSWVKSDDGKHFLPPSGTRGSGDRPGGTAPATQNGKPDASALFGEIAKALF